MESVRCEGVAQAEDHPVDCDFEVVTTGEKVMKLLAALITVAVLSGCAGTGGSGYASMTPEQLNALAKMKDASVQCIKGSTPFTGPFLTVLVTMDKGVIPEGGVTVDGDCRVSLTNTKVITTTTVTTSPVPVPVVK